MRVSHGKNSLLAEDLTEVNDAGDIICWRTSFRFSRPKRRKVCRNGRRSRKGKCAGHSKCQAA
jgi:hypothetical protein